MAGRRRLGAKLRNDPPVPPAGRAMLEPDTALSVERPTPATRVPMRNRRPSPSVDMKNTPALPVLLAFAFFIVGTTSSCRSAKALLPPRYVVRTEQDALTLGWPQTVAVAGTGSMQPYIPGSPDPDDVVAIAAVEYPPYETLNKGDLVIYRWKNKLVIHQIVARQGDKWIAAGLNNAYYDGPAVSRETFLSRVKQVYVLAQVSKRRSTQATDARSHASPFATRAIRESRHERQLASLKVRPLKTRRASRP